MKSLHIAAAVLTATIAITGCKNRKEEPVPAPNAAWPTAAAQAAPSANAPGKASSATGRHDANDRHGASGISWFQGTIEEAFSTTCRKCASMFRR
jgi:hypothetical protein